MIWICISTVAQSQKKMFVRVVDNNGQISHRGFLTKISDSSIAITQLKTLYEIPISKILQIKLRRSFGHTVLLASLFSGVSFAILGAATADPSSWIYAYTAGEGLLLGLVSGIQMGGVIGSIVGGTRKRPILNVNMNQEQWMKVKLSLKAYLPDQSN